MGTVMRVRHVMRARTSTTARHRKLRTRPRLQLSQLMKKLHCKMDANRARLVLSKWSRALLGRSTTSISQSAISTPVQMTQPNAFQVVSFLPRTCRPATSTGTPTSILEKIAPKDASMTILLLAQSQPALGSRTLCQNSAQVARSPQSKPIGLWSPLCVNLQLRVVAKECRRLCRSYGGLGAIAQQTEAAFINDSTGTSVVL